MQQIARSSKFAYLVLFLVCCLLVVVAGRSMLSKFEYFAPSGGPGLEIRFTGIAYGHALIPEKSTELLIADGEFVIRIVKNPDTNFVLAHSMMLVAENRDASGVQKELIYSTPIGDLFSAEDEVAYTLFDFNQQPAEVGKHTISGLPGDHFVIWYSPYNPTSVPGIEGGIPSFWDEENHIAIYRLGADGDTTYPIES